MTPLKDVKQQAADRWVAAVNADGRFGRWQYLLVEKPSDTSAKLTELSRPQQAAA
jgi:type III restriction enzyme